MFKRFFDFIMPIPVVTINPEMAGVNFIAMAQQLERSAQNVNLAVKKQKEAITHYESLDRALSKNQTLTDHCVRMFTPVR